MTLTKKNRRSRFRFADLQATSQPLHGIERREDDVSTVKSARHTEDTIQGSDGDVHTAAGAECIEESVQDDGHIPGDAMRCSTLDSIRAEFRDEPLEQGGADVEVQGNSSANSEEVMDLTDRERPSAVSPITSREEDTTILKIPNWRVLWGILMTTGAKKMTRFQYQSMRVICDTFLSTKVSSKSWFEDKFDGNDNCVGMSSIVSLPHYNTLLKTYKPMLFKTLTVRGFDSVLPIDSRKAGARANTYATDGTPQMPVRIVLPSEFAREDLATPSLFSEMRKACLSSYVVHGDAERAPCIDLIPVIAGREYFYGTSRCFSVDIDREGGYSHPVYTAEIGDVVALSVRGSESFGERVREIFQSETSPSELEGMVSCIFTVHHRSRKDLDGFEISFGGYALERDRALGNCFGFLDYVSPSDSVSVEVPELPELNEMDLQVEDADEDGAVNRRSKRRRTPEMEDAQRRRREALKKRRQSMETAWRDWVTPVVKPGDIVAVLRPLRSADNSRLLVTFRFWIEKEEPSRHVIFVPGEATIPSGRTVQNCEVRQVCRSVTSDGHGCLTVLRFLYLVRRHSGKRGLAKYKPISSMGTLQNGEPYFIYRFLLYWDGFELSVGKSASGDGFYLVCLNLPVEARSSSCAVRIITLTPPGVQSEAIFKLIQDDILTGLTVGFVDIDAEGTRRRIFLDLVGFLGDTPALNAVLDILGHTANACCHVCRFVRHTYTLVGSRYTDKLYHGQKTESGRSFFLHQAVRDCGAGKETCRLLGMRTMDTSGGLPLHQLTLSFAEAKKHIPKTSEGVPVLPGVLDPYKACFIAPDHLLTGHFRDCLNLAFELLPSKGFRKVCESRMIGFLHDCDLPVQNRLYDHGKRALYSMSMTELYSLAVVAEYALLKGCEVATRSSSYHAQPSERCWQAIRLVGSCSKVISRVWLHEELVSDRRKYILELQTLMDTHLSLVQTACTMKDEDIAILDDPRLPAAAKKNLLREQHSCLRAIRATDKPNVHRLLELVRCTLPMIGNISVVGELVLEKTHQALKRAIRQSNNKLVQLQSMSSVIFTDWQGRLSMVVQDALRGDQSALRSCIRLLAGRSAVATMSSSVAEMYFEHVKRAIGPLSCVPDLLRRDGKAVMSWRRGSNSAAELSWALEGNLRTIVETESESGGCAYSALRMLCRTRRVGPVIMGKSIRATASNGVNEFILHSDDIVQVNCYHSQSMDAHWPFLLCRETAGELQASGKEGPTFWGIVSLLKTTAFSQEPKLWAALRPCLAVATSSPENRYELNHTLYEIGRRVSFAPVTLDLRKVGKLHDCDHTFCTVAPHTNNINHSPESALAPGSRVFLKTRIDMYPPRCG